LAFSKIIKHIPSLSPLAAISQANSKVSGMAQKKLYISAQLYALRDFLQTPKDMVKTMRRIRKIGYESAKISVRGPIAPAVLRQLMLAEGVEPIGAHISLAEYDDIDAVAATCHAWGVKYVAIPAIPPDALQTAAAWKEAGKRHPLLHGGTEHLPDHE
jgi:hypothetical protein